MAALTVAAREPTEPEVYRVYAFMQRMHLYTHESGSHLLISQFYTCDVSLDAPAGLCPHRVLSSDGIR